MNKDPFKEYIKEPEPAKRGKRYAWRTAIGLQAVDVLKTSEYLVHTAVRNIEGEVSFEEANALLQTYYEENPPVMRQTVLRKQTRFSHELLRFFLSLASVLRRMNISLSTENCLPASTPIPDAFGIITSRRRNGC